MQRTSLPFPDWATHNMVHVVSTQIYRHLFTPPPLLHLEAEDRGSGNWQFFVVRPQALDMEGYLALSLTCQAQESAVSNFLFNNTFFELTIVSSATPGFPRFQDPHSIIEGLRRLDIWLTPEINTRSRSDFVAKIHVGNDGRVARCGVDMRPIAENIPVSVTGKETWVEKSVVQRIVLRDLRSICLNRTWTSGVLARTLTMLEDARWDFGILEGKDWMTDALGWLNYVNLDGDDSRMEDSEEEEEKNSGDEEDSDVEPEEMEQPGEGAGHGDAEIAEEGSDESEGSEMSVDDVRLL